MLDPLTIALMLAAGLLHASWHAVIKSGTNQISALAGMGLVAGAASACVLPFVAFPDAAVWPVIAISTVLHVGYKLALVRAYSRSDLGQAFPLARGFVPLFATGLAFGLMGELPSIAQLASISVVSLGLLWLAYDAIRGGIHRQVFFAACAAGCIVAAYTALDAYGVRLSGDWVSFTFWLIVIDNGTFALLARAMQGPALWQHFAEARVRVLASGLLGLGSFLVLLWALGRGPVGPVVALRESGVLFASLIGVLVLRERPSVPRVFGAVLICAGLVAIVVVR